jgi:hypothetical protein
MRHFLILSALLGPVAFSFGQKAPIHSENKIMADADKPVDSKKFSTHPMPNGYQGDNCVPIPNGYTYRFKQDRSIAMPNVYDLDTPAYPVFRHVEADSTANQKKTEQTISELRKKLEQLERERRSK